MVHLLFVCTGNICRSPMASAFAASRLGSHVGGVRISSAGVLSPGRRPTPEMLTVMQRRGMDLTGHRSRSLASALEHGTPDLVIGMAREHVLEVVENHPDLLPRTFTLRDLVRRAEAQGPRRPGERLERYVARLGAGRQAADVVRAPSQDDIADPIGRPIAVYEQSASEIEDLVARMADLLWPAGS